MALTDAADQLEWAKTNTSGARNRVGTFYHVDERNKSLTDWNGFYNLQKIEKFILESTNATDWSKFPAANACKNYGTDCGLQSPGNTSGWFLPSLGMIQYVWKTADDIETALKKYKMPELLDERFATIKTYLKDGKDPVYNDGQYTYKDNIKGFDSKKSYWSSNETSSTSATVLNAICAALTFNKIEKKASNSFSVTIGGSSATTNFILTARAFLAF